MTDKAGEDLLRLPENGVPATSPQEIERESGSRQNQRGTVLGRLSSFKLEKVTTHGVLHKVDAVQTYGPSIVWVAWCSESLIGKDTLR